MGHAIDSLDEAHEPRGWRVFEESLGELDLGREFTQ